jgi:hypothetical protein
MSILDRIKPPQPEPQPKSEFELAKHEIELLLVLIKNSTFVGEQVEDLYGTVYKLQQQYLLQN